jgi:diaminohydroxyphosphoribosylaminopyrimidine deaminase/5-amino-6-(5-phosphoribosylamino)uracil reductase
VIAKWAQTIDWRVATRTGESQWISCEASRRRVHRLRARVDAVVTGMGTVRADNPRLTARGVARVRRVARRVVIDPRAELPLDAALLQTAGEAPVTLVYDAALINERAGALAALASRGVELLPAPSAGGRLDLREVLRTLGAAHNMTNVLVEAGPGLLGSMLGADLIDEAQVYIAPLLLGDEQAVPAARGANAPSLADGRRFALFAQRRSGSDALLVFRRHGV